MPVLPRNTLCVNPALPCFLPCSPLLNPVAVFLHLLYVALWVFDANLTAEIYATEAANGLKRDVKANMAGVAVVVPKENREGRPVILTLRRLRPS